MPGDAFLIGQSVAVYVRPRRDELVIDRLAVEPGDALINIFDEFWKKRTNSEAVFERQRRCLRPVDDLYTEVISGARSRY